MGGGQLPLLLSSTVYSPVRCVCESNFFADTCTRRVPIFIIVLDKTSNFSIITSNHTCNLCIQLEKR